MLPLSQCLTIWCLCTTVLISHSTCLVLSGSLDCAAEIILPGICCLLYARWFTHIFYFLVSLVDVKSTYFHVYYIYLCMYVWCTLWCRGVCMNCTVTCGNLVRTMCMPLLDVRKNTFIFKFKWKIITAERVSIYRTAPFETLFCNRCIRICCEN